MKIKISKRELLYICAYIVLVLIIGGAIFFTGNKKKENVIDLNKDCSTTLPNTENAQVDLTEDNSLKQNEEIIEENIQSPFEQYYCSDETSNHIMDFIMKEQENSKGLYQNIYTYIKENTLTIVYMYAEDVEITDGLKQSIKAKYTPMYVKSQNELLQNNSGCKDTNVRYVFLDKDAKTVTEIK